MELPLAGQAYTFPTQELQLQECINWYPILLGDKYVALMPTPGLYSSIDTEGEEVRTLFKYNNKLYTVVDDKFYVLDFNSDSLVSTKTLIGQLFTGSGFIDVAFNNTQIMMVDGDNYYIYDTSDSSFSQNPDVDFPGAETVVNIDGYFIFNEPNSSNLWATALNDGTTISALDFDIADNSPDDLVAVASVSGELWALGSETIEVYDNIGAATGFPLSPKDGAVINQGCSAKGSVINIDNTLVFLDDRGFIVRSQGYNLEVLSTEVINADISSYKTRSDAIAYSYSDRGHLFYVITFPSENKTWVYDFLTRSWHRRAYFSQDNEYIRHLSNCQVKFKEYNLVGGYNDGNIYVMSEDYFDDNGDLIHRKRTTSYINQEFDFIEVSELQLRCESGKALQTGTGSNPNIHLRYTNNRGHIWSDILDESSGQVGDYNKLIKWDKLGTERDWCFEITFNDPIRISLLNLYAYIEGSKG